MTEEIEINPEIYKNLYFDKIRDTRNKLLTETDKYLIPDYPITPEKLELIKIYRQQLRDYMNLPNINTEIIEFPKFPF